MLNKLAETQAFGKATPSWRHNLHNGKEQPKEGQRSGPSSETACVAGHPQGVWRKEHSYLMDRQEERATLYC